MIGRVSAAALLLFLLALATAPVALDWVAHVAAHSWTWYSLVFPPLLWMEARGREPIAPRPGWAYLLVAIGGGAIIWADAATAVRFGRPGLLCCLAGVLLAIGRLRWAAVPLLALCLPVPDFLLRAVSAPLLASYGAAVDSVASLAGGLDQGPGLGLERVVETVAWAPSDLGLSSVLFAVGVQWAVELRGRTSLGRGLLRCGVAGVAGFGVHFAGTCGWRMASAAGGDVPRSLRDLGVLVVLAGVILIPFCRGSAASFVGAQGRRD